MCFKTICFKTLAKKNNQPRSGFSLVELMVVLAIIGMLTAAVTIGIRRARQASRRTTAELEIGKIVEGLELYNTQTARYPNEDEGLEVLTVRIDGLDPILKKKGELNDPWGSPYLYRVIRGGDEPFEVTSAGPDRIAGNSDDLSNLLQP